MSLNASRPSCASFRQLVDPITALPQECCIALVAQGLLSLLQFTSLGRRIAGIFLTVLGR
jgi:hypothetical protein